MPKAAFCPLDTETGGLDPRVHPLLSVAMLAVGPGLNILDEFSIKLLPPAGALLEVQRDPADTSFNPKIGHLVAEDGTELPCDERGNPHDPKLADCMRISAGAARVNGFTWKDWNATAIPREQADASFAQFIDQWFDGEKAQAVAHNAEFDEKFLLYHLPNAHAKLKQPWLCTMKALREHNKRRGIKGGAKLSDLAKLANEDPSTPAFGTLTTKEGNLLSKAHEAMADTKMCLAGLVYLQSHYNR